MADTLLIDGDIIRYRCAFSAEKTHYIIAYTNEGYPMWVGCDNAKQAKEELETGSYEDGKVFSRKEIQPVEFALQSTKTTMEAILGHFDSVRYRVYLSGPTNFRIALATSRPYKADRPQKPKWYKEVGKYLEENYGARYTDGEEADDIIAKDMLSLGDGGIIVSTDKDLDQVPGRHFNWVTGELYGVSRREAAFNFCRQILTGDSTDNIPGLDGVGEVKANKILDGAQNNNELMGRVWGAYRDHGKPRSYFVEQASLIKIGERFAD